MQEIAIAAIRQAVDRILAGELDPMLELLAEDVTLQVAVGGNSELCLEEWGAEAVASYFRTLAPLVTFWQIDYTARGDQLIAWGRESFTVEPCGMEAGSEFALVFDLDEVDRITRVLVIEDLPAYFRAGRAIGRHSSRPWAQPSVEEMVEHLASRGVSLV